MKSTMIVGKSFLKMIQAKIVITTNHQFHLQLVNFTQSHINTEEQKKTTPKMLMAVVCGTPFPLL